MLSHEIGIEVVTVLPYGVHLFEESDQSECYRN